MGVWNSYESRRNSQGIDKRTATLKRETHALRHKLSENLSYQILTIDDIEQEVSVINSDSLNEKTIISLPGENLKLGGLVYWMNNYWLITDKDANNTIYSRGTMLQCNYLLKWVSEDEELHEQWCVVEDGTKYLTGESENRDFVITRGDSRLAVTIAKNKYTLKLNRESRFLIDDPGNEHMLAYMLTKPLKVGKMYNNEGVYKFVVQEVTSTADDNHELGIADYYKYFPKINDNSETNNSNDTPNISEKRSWL